MNIINVTRLLWHSLDPLDKTENIFSINLPVNEKRKKKRTGQFLDLVKKVYCRYEGEQSLR